MAVVQQPIKDCGGHHLVAEHLVPLLHGAVGADQHAALLVAEGDQLEEQVPRLGFERQVALPIVGAAFRAAVDQQFRLAVRRFSLLAVTDYIANAVCLVTSGN